MPRVQVCDQLALVSRPEKWGWLGYASPPGFQGAWRACAFVVLCCALLLGFCFAVPGEGANQRWRVRSRAPQPSPAKTAFVLCSPNVRGALPSLLVRRAAGPAGTPGRGAAACIAGRAPFAFTENFQFLVCKYIPQCYGFQKYIHG